MALCSIATTNDRTTDSFLLTQVSTIAALKPTPSNSYCRVCGDMGHTVSLPAMITAAELSVSKEEEDSSPYLAPAIEDFDVSMCLGVGGFAKVQAAMHRSSRQWFALKVVSKHHVLSRKSGLSTLSNELKVRVGGE